MDTLQGIRERYSSTVASLLEQDLKIEPLEAKYLARDILLKMKDVISHEMNSINKEDQLYSLYQGMLCAVLYQMGSIYVNTEELAKGEEFLKNCFDCIPDHLSPRFVLMSLKVRHDLGLIWYHRSQWDDCRNWLEGAEKLYKDYTSQSDEEPKTLLNQFEEPESSSGRKETEKLYTKIKFCLAQVYTYFNDLIKSAIYCNETLRRQLLDEDYDAIDWAVSSSTLSLFFVEKHLFKQAKHHLAAACYILDNYVEKLKDFTGTKEELDEKQEEVQHRSADISRCWAKYGIHILEQSKIRLNNPDEELVEEKNEELENLWFTNLNLSLYEDQITDTTVLFFEDARNVFLTTQKHLNKAKEYYTLEERASDHVQIVKNHSILFALLIAFEKDEERQYKMNRKRIQLLETVTKELNPKYYLDLCRQLWFELGEIYHWLMSFQTDKVNKSNKVPTPNLLQKINSLVENSIKYFNLFIDSVKDKKTEQLPEVPPDDLLESTLAAHFYLGQLWLKYITFDKVKKLQNTDHSYNCFKYLIDCCEKSEKAKEVVGEQLNISKEMVTLLQMKKLKL